MRIAVVHDYLDNLGGGEKLALLLAQELGADFITTQLDIKIPKLFRLKTKKIIALGRLPSRAPFKQIYASWLFSRYSYKEYDFVIFSGNWSVFGARRTRRNIWYCHSPCREFFDLREDMRRSLSLYLRPFFTFWTSLHRYFYFRAISHVCSIVTNSLFTQRKITRFLHRYSTVIYPPIEKIGVYSKKNLHWLCVSRIYPAKNIHLLLEIFRSLPAERLVIVGDVAPGDHSKKYLRKILSRMPSNVSIFPRISQQKLSQFMGDAKGFISLAKGEDFGMNIAEALEAHVPVVCTHDGGHVEIVEHGVNGYLVPLRKKEILEAIASIQYIYDAKNLHDFSLPRFVKEMRRVIR